MADKVPIKATFDSAGDADGLGEMASGETIGYAHGGTGLSALGTAGQLLRVNSGANAIEWGAAEVLNIDGMTDGSSITIADTDKFGISDAGTEKYINASQIRTYLIKDEDDMSSNSATHMPSQQSVKAYVDGAIQTEESIEDFVGGMVTGNTETFITVTYEDSDGTMDFVVPVKDEDDMSSDSDAFLATQQSIKAYVDNAAVSSEQVQDIVGAMFTSNTETGIAATYEDSDGTIDLVVSADSALIKDTDNDTKIQVEEGSDEDKIRYDVAGTEVAVQDVSGMSFTTNSSTVRHHQTQAATYTIPANEGQIMAGPVTITGTITNNGTLVVV